MTKLITEPLVSIVIRTCNRPFLLSRALESILAQTYPCIEVVLVDDGRYKINPALRSSFQTKTDLSIISTGQFGRSAAGNTGIRHAKGTFIIFLDDDDTLYPDHVRILVNGVIRHQTIVYTDCELSYETYDEKKDTFTIEKTIQRFSQDFNRGLLFSRNYIPLMTLCFPSDLLMKSSGFDESLDLYEDWDLLLRLSFLTEFVHLPGVTAKYRIWGNNQITQIDRPEQKNPRGRDMPELQDVQVPLVPRSKDRVLYSGKISNRYRNRYRQKFPDSDYLSVASRYLNKITPEDLHDIFLYSEEHFDQCDELTRQNRMLAEENATLKQKVLEAEQVRKQKHQIQLENTALKKEMEKKDIYLTELKRINQLYVDENLRKEERLAALEHKLLSFGENLKSSDEKDPI